MRFEGPRTYLSQQCAFRTRARTWVWSPVPAWNVSLGIPELDRCIQMDPWGLLYSWSKIKWNKNSDSQGWPLSFTCMCTCEHRSYTLRFDWQIIILWVYLEVVSSSLTCCYKSIWKKQRKEGGAYFNCGFGVQPIVVGVWPGTWGSWWCCVPSHEAQSEEFLCSASIPLFMQSSILVHLMQPLIVN